MRGDPLPPYRPSTLCLPYTPLPGEGESSGSGLGGQGVAGAPQAPYRGGWIGPELQVNWWPRGSPLPPPPLVLNERPRIAQPQRDLSRRRSDLCGRGPQRREEGRGVSYLPLRTEPSSARLHRLREPWALGATEPRDRGDGPGFQGLGSSEFLLFVPAPVRPQGAESRSGATAPRALGARRDFCVLYPPGASERGLGWGAMTWPGRRIGAGATFLCVWPGGAPANLTCPFPQGAVGSRRGGSKNGPCELLKGQDS